MADETVAAAAPTTLEEIDDVDIDSMFKDLSKKKKKKSKKEKKKKKKGSDDDANDNSDDDSAANGSDSSGYAYSTMLGRIYSSLQAKNPELLAKKRYKLKPPQIMRIGTRKCMWVNFPEICETIKRKPDHVYLFFLTELGTTGSTDGNGRLIFKGTFVPKKIESLLIKYIGEYVTCSGCKTPDTKLEKEQASRLFFVTCNACGARRAVSTISKGFVATQRGERRAMRNK
jgi:translation initiation factor 2 subunit 2|eukprot:Stramenopile-MAST_4_protein_2740